MATNTANWALIKPGAADLVDPVGNAPSHLNTNFDSIDAQLGQDGLLRPADTGALLGWTGAPAFANNATAVQPATQSFYVYGVRVTRPGTSSGMVCQVANAPSAAGSTHSQIAAYGSGGVLLGATTDNTGAAGLFGSAAALLKVPWAATFAAPVGYVYVLIWIVSTQVTRPALYGETVSLSPVAVNDSVAQTTTAVRIAGRFDVGSATNIPASITVAAGVVSIAGQTATQLAGRPWLALY